MTLGDPVAHARIDGLDVRVDTLETRHGGLAQELRGELRETRREVGQVRVDVGSLAMAVDAALEQRAVQKGVDWKTVLACAAGIGVPLAAAIIGAGWAG
jgi:hypothetical protein